MILRKFYKVLSKEFRKIEMNELQARRTLDCAGFKTYPKPEGIPGDCSVEITKLSGGMIYRKAGTIEEQKVLVRVMPGKREKNIVTAFAQGDRPKWSLRQETPYVVQTRNREIFNSRW